MSNKVPKRPRLLFINRSYWPDVEATGQLLTELCEALADKFEITVMCGRPQKIVERVPADFSQMKERNRVQIIRVRHTQFEKASFIGRIANMLTFQGAATWRTLLGPRYDAVIVETDPPFLCLLGRLLQLLRRIPLVCYLQDIYPDVAVALGKLKPRLMAGLLRRAFFGAYRRCDAVVVLSRDMRDFLVDHGVPPGRIHVIPNWIDTELVKPIKHENQFRAQHALADKFVVMYSGNLGMSQNLIQVLEAAQLLQVHSDIVFVFIGDGVDRPGLEEFARKRKMTNVRFFNYQPKSSLATSLSAADLHLVVLRQNIRRFLMPSKIYGALASGTPILALASEDCELAEIVKKNEVGRVVAGETPRELADAVLAMARDSELLARQSINARAFAVARCTRDSSVMQLQSLLEDVLPLRRERTTKTETAELVPSIQ